MALSVPQVISCFTAAGPSSAAVGDGRLGTSGKLVGELGRSKSKSKDDYKMVELLEKHLQEVPLMAASIRLLVGLGGEGEVEVERSVVDKRVFPCLIVFGSPLTSDEPREGW